VAGQSSNASLARSVGYATGDTTIGKTLGNLEGSTKPDELDALASLNDAELKLLEDIPWAKKLSRRSCSVKSEVFIARELPVSAELAGKSAPAMSTQPLAPDSA